MRKCYEKYYYRNKHFFESDRYRKLSDSDNETFYKAERVKAQLNAVEEILIVSGFGYYE